MFFLLSKLLDVLLSPLWWALLLGLFGVKWRGHEPGRARKWAARAGVALLIIFSTEQVATRLLRSLEDSARTTLRDDDPPFDAVIVLGGMVEEPAMRSSSDRPSLNDNVERVLEALRLFREGRARNILVSAGSQSPSAEQAHESSVLLEFLLRSGVARERIALDARSRNTHENAVESARIARERGWTRLVAVTSAFHGRRAQGTFRASGLEPRWLLADRRARVNARWGALDLWIPRAKSLAVSEFALREMAGWWIYRAQGYARAE
ncbi:MAG: YdcF family protein [Polyangiales bacterium]